MSASDIDFNFGQFSLNAGFAITDSSGNSAIVGLKSSWDPTKNSFAGASIPNLYSMDSGYSSQITDVTILDAGRYENNQTVSNADTNLGLVMGVSPITLQIEADLDTGLWTARGKFGDSDWVNLTLDGSGFSNISSLEIFTSYDNSNVPSVNWGTNASDGATGNYITVDQLSLVEESVQAVADISINGTNWAHKMMLIYWVQPFLLLSTVTKKILMKLFYKLQLI